MSRVSDRLPFRRRSGGGKHVATRGPRRRSHTLLQAGLAAALAAGLGFVAVNPALGGATRTETTAGAVPSAAAVADERARRAARQSARQDLAQIADEAVAQVAQVRAKAQSAQLPADRLAALDSVERQVHQLAGKLAPQRLTRAGVSRVSRGTERAGVGAADALGPAGTAATDALGPAGPAATETATAATSTAVGPEVPDASADSDPLPGGAGQASTATAGAGAAQAAGTAAAHGATDAAAAGSSSATGSPAGTRPGLDITDAATLTAVLPRVAVADDRAALALRHSLLALVRTAADVDAAADRAQAAAAQAAAEQAAAAAAQAAADAAAAAQEQQRRQWADSLDGYPNGRIPASALCAPSFDPQALLRCDAAQALDRLDAAYATVFGANLQVTDSYRSYAAQVTCRRTKGSLCARPGTSNHGWGLAVDLGGAAHSAGTEAHDWLLANARTYGWDLPGWARANGSKPEPWHWEYVA